MFHRVVTVHAMESRCLLAWFKGGEARLYDVRQLYDRWPQFLALEECALFESVQVDAGGYGVSWTDELDLSADELYANGAEVFELTDQEARVIAEFSSARKEQGVSQRALEDVSGVSQPAIARMESGRVTPRLDTLLKLLAPLGKTLQVVDLDLGLEDASSAEV